MGSSLTWAPTIDFGNSVPITNRVPQVRTGIPTSREFSLSQEAYWIDSSVFTIRLQLEELLNLVRHRAAAELDVETPIQLQLPPKKRWEARFIIDEVRKPSLSYPKD